LAIGFGAEVKRFRRDGWQLLHAGWDK
jgi:hypothetical protein